MVLKKPNVEDLNKLNAEINQVVNQRFVLATLAITIMAVVSGWLFMEQNTLFENGEIGGIVYAMSFFLLLLIFVLFYFAQMLYAKLRIYSTYLLVTEASNWESDWKLFRDKKRYLGYRKGQAFLYLLLGIAAFLIPIVFALVLPLRLSPWVGFGALLSLFILYAVFVCGMGFGGWFDPEEGVIDKWKELKNAT